MLKRGLDERLQGLAAGGLGLSVPGAGLESSFLNRKRELRRAGPSQSKSVLAGESPAG